MQKMHVSSLATRNLKSSFLVVRILCKSLNKKFLNLISLVAWYISENLTFQFVNKLLGRSEGGPGVHVTPPPPPL